MLKMTLLTLFSTSAVVVGARGSIAPPQPEECARYVECQAHVDVLQGAESVDASEYEADGVCWRRSSEAADACSRFCEPETEAIGVELEADGEELGPCE